MRLKMFEDFETSPKKGKYDFSENDITDFGNTIISLLDSFCDEYRLRTNKPISHDEIEIIDGNLTFKLNGLTFQWNISCDVNLTISIYTAGNPGGSDILNELYKYLRVKFIDKIRSKYHIYTFKKYEPTSSQYQPIIPVVDDIGDNRYDVWLGGVIISLGKLHPVSWARQLGK